MVGFGEVDAERAEATGAFCHTRAQLLRVVKDMLAYLFEGLLVVEATQAGQALQFGHECLRSLILHLNYWRFWFSKQIVNALHF